MIDRLRALLAAQKNPSVSAITLCGASICGRCPTPGIGVKSAFTSRLASSLPRATGIHGSILAPDHFYRTAHIRQQRCDCVGVAFISLRELAIKAPAPFFGEPRGNISASKSSGGIGETRAPSDIMPAPPPRGWRAEGR